MKNEIKCDVKLTDKSRPGINTPLNGKLNTKSNFIAIPGKHFYQYAKSAKKNNKDYGCCFDLYSAEKYTKDCICFIKHVPDGVIGYAMECKNGQYDTITSVFKSPGAKVSRCLYSIIDHAKNNGGKRLDCFEGLVGYYNDLGFETYFVEQWDDKQAPPDWNPALGKPAVHYMYVK